VIPFVLFPDPTKPNAAALLRQVQSWCSPQLADDVQITGERVTLPWPVVRAILVARDLRPLALVPELQRFGHVLADDDGLTVIADTR
jgi:hypothetical protein